MSDSRLGVRGLVLGLYGVEEVGSKGWVKVGD